MSSVVATFTSSAGHVVATPSSVKFDYTNFDTPVDVTIVAIENFVDEGDTRTDSIVASFQSEDSEEECDRAPVRRSCGQAMLYNGKDLVDPVDVTIKDDDTAGLDISATDVEATYDNYGDPLQAARFTVRLTSKPTRNVKVPLENSDQFSTTTVMSKTGASNEAELLFTLDNWATPQYVQVAAAAPTAVNTLIISIELEGDSRTAADCVFWTTIGSIFTVTCVLIFVAQAGS